MVSWEIEELGMVGCGAWAAELAAQKRITAKEQLAAQFEIRGAGR